MKSKADSLIAGIKDVIGLQIVEIEGVIWASNSCSTLTELDAIQLTLSDRSVLLVAHHADGESLTVSNESWQDPFDGSLDADTTAWLDNVGNPKLVNLSQFNQFKFVLNHEVTNLNYVVNSRSSAEPKVCGMQIITDAKVMNIYTAMEYIYVEWGKHPDLHSNMSIVPLGS